MGNLACLWNQECHKIGEVPVYEYLHAMKEDLHVYKLFANMTVA